MSNLYWHHCDFGDLAETFALSGAITLADAVLVDAAVHRLNERDPEVLLAAALALAMQRSGHVGVDLVSVQAVCAAAHVAGETPHSKRVSAPWPEDPQAWQRKVLQSSLVSVDGDWQRPFAVQVLPDGRHLLMTQRVWSIQCRLADGLLRMAREEAAHAPQLASLQTALSESLLAHARPEHLLATQAMVQSLASAAQRQMVLVVGGPGTGKTYSIRFLLTALLEHKPDLRVLLAAPTGKAAVRMTEAMREAKGGAVAEDTIDKRLANLRSMTVHKLLGKHPDGSVKYHRGKPLLADVVVVDEASMVDLVLMAEVVDAMAVGAQLVLLGDPDQLASVDVGTVLSDIVAAASRPHSPLEPCMVRLTINHRFAEAPLISAVAAAIQAQTPESLQTAVALLTGQSGPPQTPPGMAAAGTCLPLAVSTLAPIAVATLADRSRAIETLAAPYCQGDGYVTLLAGHLQRGGRAALATSRVRRELLLAMGRYRVLAVHRKGPLGVAGLDKSIGEQIRMVLAAAWAKRHGDNPQPATLTPADLPRDSGLWLGQLVLITENAYDVDLRNGDIGLVLCGEGERLVVVFPVATPADESVNSPMAKWPGAREVPIARLPPHMGALAMTVHKSQGSQFDHIALVLADGDSPIQTRELIYTAITRAKKQLTWAGSEQAMAQALGQTVARASGLGPLLEAR